MRKIIYNVSIKKEKNMEYLIKDTTKEERKKIAKNALAISVGSNEMPSKEVIELVKEYIDGKMELAEVQKKIIERYKKI